MHSVLPHVHHDQLSNAEHELVHESADNLIDYIKLIFHTDMGDGHLEHFESGQGFDLGSIAVNAPILGIFETSTFIVSEEVKFITIQSCLKEEPFPDPPNYSLFSLRGPPTFS